MYIKVHARFNPSEVIALSSLVEKYVVLQSRKLIKLKNNVKIEFKDKFSIILFNIDANKN